MNGRFHREVAKKIFLPKLRAFEVKLPLLLLLGTPSGYEGVRHSADDLLPTVMVEILFRVRLKEC